MLNRNSNKKLVEVPLYSNVRGNLEGKYGSHCTVLHYLCCFIHGSVILLCHKTLLNAFLQKKN